MKQHFASTHEYGLYEISAKTREADMLCPDKIFISASKSEITQACINRIVDNLNKLAEHNAKNGGINEV